VVSGGSSLLPTMVRLSPTCTGTLTPSTCRVILVLMFQPSEPVENSLTSASCSLPSMITLTGLAPLRNWARVMGQVLFLAIGAPPGDQARPYGPNRTARGSRQDAGILVEPAAA